MKYLKSVSIILIIILLCVSNVFAQKDETITERERDTVLLMTARENPHYDICLVMDISDSMSSALEKLKTQAMKVVDFAKPGDTLIFIKFDHYTRKPLIQKVDDKRDVEMFKYWIRKTTTTKGFGTDIQAAYFAAMDTLMSLNKARKMNGKPIRIQYVVFVSDGDDIPPAHSDFRNPAGKKRLKLMKYIKQAEKEQLIKIIPVGMKFEGYLPKFVRFDPDHIPDSAKITDPELKKFVEQLKDALKRSPTVAAGSTTVRVPRKPYQFYIDWLSGKMELSGPSVSEGDEKNTVVYKYRVMSSYKELEVKNLTASPTYSHGEGKLQAEIIDSSVSENSLDPGDSATVKVVLRYPINWSFRKRKSEGTLKMVVTGEMELSDKTGAIVSSTATPSPSPTPTTGPSTGTVLEYPFNKLQRQDAVSVEVPVTRALYWYAGLGVLALLFLPLAFLYQVAVPITVTVRTKDKARAFRLAHQGKITIGARADFVVSGGADEIAEIQRRFRRFVLVEKEPGAIPESHGAKMGQLPLKLGEGFSLSVAGSYEEFEFLPGNQEYADEEEELETITDMDLDEDLGDFQF